MDWIPDSAIFLMADQGCEIEILHLDLAHDNAVLDPLQIDVDPVCVRVSVSLSEPESTSASRLPATVHASQQPFTTDCLHPVSTRIRLLLLFPRPPLPTMHWW